MQVKGLEYATFSAYHHALLYNIQSQSDIPQTLMKTFKKRMVLWKVILSLSMAYFMVYFHLMFTY
jgi:hypothetical protein